MPAQFPSPPERPAPVNPVRLPVFLFFLVCATVPARADMLELDNGKPTREGKILEYGPGTVKFHDPLEGIRDYPRAMIKEVRWSDLSNLLKIAEANPKDPFLPNEFQKAAMNTLSKANDAKGSGDLAGARANYRALYDALASPAGRRMSGAGTFEPLVRAIQNEMPQTSFELGKQSAASADAATRRIAQTYLMEAATMRSDRAEYWMELGKCAEANRDFAAAKTAYAQVTKMQSPQKAVLEAAAAALARVSAANPASPAPGQTPGTVAVATPLPARPVASVPSTPAPPAGVKPAAATPANATAAAPPAAAPAPAANDTPAPNSVAGRFQAAIDKLGVRTYYDDLMRGDYNAILAGVGGFVVVFFMLPSFFLGFRAKRGDMFAAEYHPRARRIGLVAVFLWWKKYANRPQPKDLCPNCGKSLDNIESYQDLNFLTCPHCRENITPVYDLPDYVKHLISQLRFSGAGQDGNATGMGGAMVVEKDAMTKLVKGVITIAVRKRASDVQAETELDSMKIRCRVDGIMYELLTLPRQLAAPFVNAIKIMSNLDITEKRIPQDGKMSLWIDKVDVDLRIATSPSSIGEKISIRVLNQKTVLIDPLRLGIEGDQIEQYDGAIHRPNGLVIVTGPAGSGKSTTLYVALNQLNNGEKNIVTLEDPVEYVIKGVSQMQVNNAANFTFATGLRSILRQDPDVIMVGEIRDRETADAALDAATTGHQVFTTLHTIDSPGAFARLTDLGAEPRRIASAVSCIMAQRLIRVICPECKTQYNPPRRELEHLGIVPRENESSGGMPVVSALRIDLSEPINYMHGTGCAHCMKTGYFGRNGLFEFLVPDDPLREVIETGASPTVIREVARKSGFRTLREEGIRRIREGKTTTDEVVRMTSV